MHQRLHKIAVGFWLLSLLLPTIGDLHGKYILGIRVLIGGLSSVLILPFSLTYPLHILSVLTNFIVVKEIFIFASRSSKYSNLPSSVFLFFTLLLNIYIGLYAAFGEASRLNNLLYYPGYYVWVLSFFTIFVSRVLEDKA